MVSRTLNLAQYTTSLFLFGPRQTGKTYLIKHTLASDIFIDMLDHNEFLRYARDTSILGREVDALRKEKCRIVVDEIQRCPGLLDEIQRIMGNKPQVQFILTGSSARKLKHAGVNLLGGRAVVVHLHPFTHEEMGSFFMLDDALHFGTIPAVSLADNPKDKARLLKSYVETYLKEEIQQEALTRNIPAFSVFLELAAYENGNILNFQNIAREVGIHSKTIKEYFSILEDTLLGFLLYPYAKSQRTKIISHPKFYFFDCGLVTALQGRLSHRPAAGTAPYGRAFEHWVMLEIRRMLDYHEIEAKMSFFKTADGAEVDLILESAAGKVWAVEIKSLRQPRVSDVRGLRSFISDHTFNRAVCVCLTPRQFSAGGIEFLPWQDFMRQLKSL